ncbi:glycosyltransferase family 1 protein [Aplosporella prunicola CBS 121167]|uniref:UDP-N-acetylglucosamine transferase subunit ALG13 n=1 Tax=Aplosporella prunicola CBS 121167 TaxID=1176127 RepID=A0A6A6B2T7_9PEZI|nr:glycosyltransferase family 1 protein [Aplosporella prunicola CBS 121167]KAF2137327.1 glycosyltransferase family 1 protein [Aplosporella prunicola CBS 121167]
MARKHCFVTIGATAAFDALITAVFQQSFIQALVAAGYTDLLVQYGQRGKRLFAELSKQEHCKASGLAIHGFDFAKDGLFSQMRLAKGVDGSNSNSAHEGVVVSHSGSGSILDALRIGVPLIVVPNPSLLDNHQLELAETLEDQGYVVHGDLGNLAPAIAKSEDLRQRQRSWPPINSGQHRRAQGLQGVLDEEMGFLD